jgi:hypothetical protein
VVHLDGKQFVSFYLVDHAQKEYDRRRFILPIHTQKTIKNSFGIAEQRFVIKTFIRLFETDFEIELTLANRSNMEFPVLLGRRILKKKFIVDVAKKHQSLKSYQKKHKIKH